MMKNGTKVMTKHHGSGTIIGIEYYVPDKNEFRYVVELDNKNLWPFPHNMNPHYFPYEITKQK